MTHYNGIRDASAAVALDATHFVVANDERDTLVIYELGRADPVDQLHLADYLGGAGTKGKAREADLEGSARVGELIYWIASHGRDSDGHRQPRRLRFFATPLVGGRPVVPPRDVYRGLLQDMLDCQALHGLGLHGAVGKGDKGPAPEAKGGFNIEGLAAAPDGTLLIGFRNPRPGGRALILPLLNPYDVVTDHARALFGAPFLLNLGGQGIRSLEEVAGGYVLIAGPYGKDDPNKGFALYSWNGGEPVRMGYDFGNMHPEAVFVMGGDLHLLMDDGDQQGEAKFRAITLPLDQLSSTMPITKSTE